MQPAAALKKVHSVDCGQPQQIALGGPNSTGSQQTGTAGANSRSGAPLMHSVSIVVDLAKEPTSAGSVSLESSLDREDSLRSETVAGSGTSNNQTQQQQQQQQQHRQQQYAKEASISSAATTEEDESDDDSDDEDDDDSGCLRSNLARKVVIVDEADKILRNRAQSAEPRASCDLDDAHRQHRIARAGNDSDDLNGANNSKALHFSTDFCGNLPATPTTTAAGLGAVASVSNSNSTNKASRSHSTSPAPTDASSARSVSPASLSARPISAASIGRDYFPPSALASGGIGGAACSRQHRLSLAAATSGSSNLAMGGSSGELAERGELSKLGMRRNTHHHVNFNPSLGFAPGGSGSAAAAGPLSSSSMRGAINHPVRQHARSGSAQLEHYTVGPLVEALSAKAAGSSGLHGELGGHRHHHQPLHYFQQQQSAASATGLAAQSPLLLPPLSPGSQNYSQVALSPSTSKNWSQRRQSLQISLLTGGCCSPSKSLTEEELRGEREFNEQVRNSKSPDIFAYRASVASASHQPAVAGLAHSHQAPPLPTPLATSLTHHSNTPAQHNQQQRCQSVAGGSFSEIAGFAEFEAELRQRHQQQQAVGKGSCAFSQTIVGEQQAGPFAASSSSPLLQSPLLQSPLLQSPLHQSPLLPPTSPQQQQQRQQQSQRRVSFSSIDPILARAESLQQHGQYQHQLHLQRHGRASFAFYPLSHYSPPSPPTIPTRTTSAHSHDNTTAATTATTTTTTTSTQLLAALPNPSPPAGGSSPDTSSSAAAPTTTVTPTKTANSSLQVKSGAKSSPEGYIGSPASRSSLSSTTAAPAASAERTSCMTLDKQKRHSLATTVTSSSSSTATPTSAATILASLADRATSGGAVGSSILAGISNQAQHQEGQQQQEKRLLQEAQELLGHKNSQLSAASGLFGSNETTTTSTEAAKLINPTTRTQQKPSSSPSATTEAASREKPSLPFMFSADNSSSNSSSSSSSSSSSRDTETIATNTAAASKATSSNKMSDNDSLVAHAAATATRVESPAVEPQMEQIAQVKGAQLGQENTPMAADSNKTDSERKITSTSYSASAPGGVEQTQVVMSQATHDTKEDDSRVRSIMANARLRQEEFARLLEEHEQIVNEINRVETKISSSHTNLQQQQRQQQEDSKQ